jgi:hypothetical protein
VHTADAIKQAIAEQEERRFDSAVAILTEAIQQIQQSASASDTFCLGLVENLNECIMRTKRAKASGRDNKISYQSRYTTTFDFSNARVMAVNSESS